MGFPAVITVQRKYFDVYELLDPQMAKAHELLAAGVSSSRVFALYPLNLHQLTHHFVARVNSEVQLPLFLDRMKDSGLGLLHDYVSTEVLDELFLMPEQLDFLHPEFQKLGAAAIFTQADSNLTGKNPLIDALLSIADALWLGSRWAQLSKIQDPLVGVALVSVLENQSRALQALDSSAMPAVN